MSRRRMLWAMVAVLLVATALRLAEFGEVPPGLYRDEAYHGLDALEVLGGHLPLYFPANNGREPLFIYLVTGAVGVLGRSPFALRLPSFFAGVLTVAVTAALGKALFSRRVGVLAAAVLAVTLWHVHLSRVGFRAVLLPLFIALALWQMAHAVRRGRGGATEVAPGGRSRASTSVAAGPTEAVAAATEVASGGQSRASTFVDAAPVRAGGRPAAGPAQAVSTAAGPTKAASAAALGGLFYGLSFYTYTAARFTPVALIAYIAYRLSPIAHRLSRIARRASASNSRPKTPAISDQRSAISDERSAISDLRLALPALAATLVTLLPLAAYTALHPQAVLGRPGQVFVWNPAINHGDPWGMLASNTLRTLGMFFLRGDRIWRHNVPWRPIFGPLLGLMFLLGLLVALRRARRDPAASLVLIWTAVMSLPTLLAEDAPHFLRAVGVLPLAVFLPALGLEWLWTRLSRRRPRLAPLVVGGILLAGLVGTARAYFGDYARAPQAAYWFEDGAVGLAGDINRFLGTGWDGAHMLHTPADGRRVYLERGLWEQWPQVRFLVESPEAVTLLPAVAPESLGAGVAAFVWPYDDWRRAWDLLPSPAEISVAEGPLSQGDRDPQPYVTYLAFYALPPTERPVIARFAGGIALLGAEVTPAEGGGVRVRLIWRADEPVEADYTVFLHYLRDGERIAQGDSRAAGGRYPTTVWRPGDVVLDDHYLPEVDGPQPGRDALRFGLWLPESGESLPLLDEAGNPAGNWVDLPVH